MITNVTVVPEECAEKKREAVWSNNIKMWEDLKTINRKDFDSTGVWKDEIKIWAGVKIDCNSGLCQ